MNLRMPWVHALFLAASAANIEARGLSILNALEEPISEVFICADCPDPNVCLADEPNGAWPWGDDVLNVDAEFVPDGESASLVIPDEHPCVTNVAVQLTFEEGFVLFRDVDTCAARIVLDDSLGANPPPTVSMAPDLDALLHHGNAFVHGAITRDVVTQIGLDVDYSPMSCWDWAREYDKAEDPKSTCSSFLRAARGEATSRDINGILGEGYARALRAHPDKSEALNAFTRSPEAAFCSGWVASFHHETWRGLIGRVDELVGVSIANRRDPQVTKLFVSMDRKTWHERRLDQPLAREDSVSVILPPSARPCTVWARAVGGDAPQVDQPLPCDAGLTLNVSPGRHFAYVLSVRDDEITTIYISKPNKDVETMQLSVSSAAPSYVNFPGDGLDCPISISGRTADGTYVKASGDACSGLVRFNP